jgi:Ca2+-transporting ATPase
MFTVKELEQIPKKAKNERETVENDLTFLGIVAVLDPPREGVREAVLEVINAGITPIMITGDSPKTAGTIAREVGMLSGNQEVHEGHDIEYLTDESFFNTTVFARVSPQHKQIIVEKYQAKGKVVAMTGDGVNDALALSMSDAGICMGMTGTDVAKQASDIVITDDSYLTIVTGVRQGRTLFQKIRLMIMFYIGVNLAEGLVYFGSSFIGNFFIDGFFLLDTWQRIYIFSIVHSIPPMALIFDISPRDIMKRSPIDTAGIFNKQLLFAMLSFSLVLTTVLYIAYFGSYTGIIPFNDVNGSYASIHSFIQFQDPLNNSTALWPTSPEQLKARTMMLSVIYIAEPIFVLSIRRIDKSLIQSLKEDGFWFAYLMVFSMPVFHVLNMYFPFIQDTLNSLAGFRFDVIPLDIIDWIIVLILGSLPIISLEYYKKRNRDKGQFF